MTTPQDKCQKARIFFEGDYHYLWTGKPNKRVYMAISDWGVGDDTHSIPIISIFDCPRRPSGVLLGIRKVAASLAYCKKNGNGSDL